MQLGAGKFLLAVDDAGTQVYYVGMTQMTEHDYLLAIDAAIIEAGNKMDLLDVADLPDEAREEVYQDRFHCGVCITRTVLEEVWGKVQQYIDFVKDSQGVSVEGVGNEVN